MASSDGVVIGSSGYLPSQFLKGLTLGLRDEERGEDTAQHEESKDLHDMVEPWGGGGTLGSASGTKGTEHALGDDGADLARGGRQTVRGRAVAGGEALAGYDEGGGVRAEVEEELGEDVEGQERVFTKLVVGEADDAEENGEDCKASKLDGLAANGIDSSNGDPVAGDGTRADDDQITDGRVAEDFVHVTSSSIADGSQNDGVVETKTVVGNVEEEPGASGTQEDLAMLPLAVVAPEVAPAGLRRVKTGNSVGDSRSTMDLVRMTFTLALDVGFGVLTSLVDITSDIEGIARSFGDRETVVKSDTARHGTETNDHPPHLVNRKTADPIALGGFLGGQ